MVPLTGPDLLPPGSPRQQLSSFWMVRANGLRYGLAGCAVGGGQGRAMLLERFGP
ncbi:MAG TPA: hypothetical protein VES01_07305 [Dermatophilaceae bacterium]|nr:hypothetical protein [Dermatophilaceae bacterium]